MFTALAIVVLIILVMAAVGVFITYRIIVWSAIIGAVLLAVLSSGICALMGCSDPKSVFFLLALPAAVVGLIVWSKSAEKKRLKEEAERKAMGEAERLAREAGEQRRQAELARLNPVRRWVRKLFG